jgi:tetratricopeptide (TPR) repeat protein
MAKKAKDQTIINVDEVYTKTEQFVDKNRNQLTYGLGGAALIILLFMGYRTLVQEPAELAAEEAMFAAEHYFSKDSVDLALYGDGYSAGLEEILNDHSGTNAASRAAYLIGVSNRDAGLFEDAIESFKKVDLNDDVIGPYALAGIGDCFTDLGDFASAEGFFASAANSADAGLAANVIAPNFHYKRALVLIELGRSSEAKDALNHIVSDHPNSRLVNNAEALSASL